MGFSESTKTTNKGHFACFGGQWLPLVWVKMKLKPFRIWVDKYLFWRRIFNPPPWSSRFVFKFKFVFPKIPDRDIFWKRYLEVRGRKEKMEEKVGRLPVKLNDCTVKLTFYAPLYQKPCLMKNSKFNTG